MILRHLPSRLGEVRSAVALLSLMLLVAAFVVPETLANVFVVLGLVGLLSFRVSVMQPRRSGVPVLRTEQPN